MSSAGLPLDLARIFFDRAATWRLLAFTVCGFAFSLAVILGTLGLMDGFEASLKAGLRRSAGDALLTRRQGFFTFDTDIRNHLQSGGVAAFSPLVQSEAFALSDGRSKALMVRGVESASFSAVTGLEVQLTGHQVAVGAVLAEEWSLTEGAPLTLVLARGANSELPQFLELQVGQILTHGLYEKDSRLVYVPRQLLDEVLELYGKANLTLLKFRPDHSIEEIEDQVLQLRQELDSDWLLRTSWYEFGGILEAVEVEKKSIAIVLQLIVLVAVFNIAAFLVTLRVRKAQEFFLLRAVGLPRGRFYRFGAMLLLTVWALSCAGAWLLIQLFNWLLANVSWLQMPGDVYLLSRLQVLLDTNDYIVVFAPALLWVFLLGWWTARQVNQQSLLTGLRREFA